MHGNQMNQLNTHADDEAKFDEWWNNLRAVMKSKGVREIDDAEYVAQICRNYKSFGSKIDWDRLEVAVDGTKESEIPGCSNSIHAANFFKLMVARYRLSGDVICIGDDFMEVALIGSIDVMVEYLSELFELPQHTYLSSPNGSWVFCYSMEGYENFGFRNPS